MDVNGCRAEIKNLLYEITNLTGNEEVTENNQPKSVRKKRSTQKGEGRIKLIAALTKHHQYADGSCLNEEPIGNNALARMAKVSPASATAFFKKEFGGLEQYKKRCSNRESLIVSLKMLNSEFTPQILANNMIPGEQNWDDDDDY